MSSSAPVTQVEQDIAKEIEFYQRDPVAFTHDILGVTGLYDKSIEIMEAIRDYPRVAVAACHSSAKTFTAANVFWWHQICFPPAKAVTTAPTERQVRDLLWAEIRQRHGNARVRLPGKCATMGWRMPDRKGFHGENADWYGVGFATTQDQADEHATKFVGYHQRHVLVEFDEACGILRPIWKASDGLMASGKVRHLAIGNPTDPTSRFAEIYASPVWHSIRISAFETPNLQGHGVTHPFLVTPEWVETMRETEGEDSPEWYAKVLGLFPPHAVDTIISMAEVDEAFSREPPPFNPEEPVLIGVDVARFGSDATTIYVLSGPRILHAEGHVAKDLMWTCGRILAIAEHYGLKKPRAPQIGVDVVGLGGGVVDRLHELGWNVRAVNAAEKASNEERYRNKRTELWFGLKSWIQRACLKDCPRRARMYLKADLPAPKYKYLSDGRREMEAKDKIKERILRSPDDGDALAIAVSWYTSRTLALPPEPAVPWVDTSDDEIPNGITDRRSTQTDIGGLHDWIRSRKDRHSM